MVNKLNALPKPANLVLLMLTAVLLACTFCHGQDRPNIIVIMADDLGYGDLGCYGNKNIKTPHIDKLARNGIRFLDFHSNGVVCSPTRASLLTGKYPQSVGISGVITAKSHRHIGLDTKEVLISEVLKEKNYKTGIFGKWHLGYDTTYSPVKQGFDIFKGFTSGNIDYISHFDQENNFDWWLNTQKADEKGYTTDLITGHALRFIEQHKDKPFFLYVAHEAPHSPYQVRESAAVRNTTTQPSPLSSEKQAELYKQMIEIMDEGVGKIVASLEKNHLSKNTLILFLSDNGATKLGSNSPFRGHKGDVWEGGHRVPAIAFWKGQIKPGTSTAQLMSMDIFPTICSLTGAHIPQDTDFAGKSFKEILFNKSVRLEERPLFWGYGQSYAVRKGKWKLVNEKGRLSLFDLSKDPGEADNLHDKFPTEAKSLTELLDSWVKKMSRIPMKS
jgi:arylsulfatase A